MTCSTCGRNPQWHGSQEPNARPGTYLHECGCHDGVRMDDDDYGEGWQPDVVYPPCKFNPNRCSRCDGTGDAKPSDDRDDCSACDGTGWKDGECQWPVAADDIDETTVSTRVRASDG